MIPILYPANETAFTGMGICALVDATRCIVKEDTNWTFELEMDYPTNGRFFSEIKINRIILAEPAPGKQTEPFDIYSLSVSENGIATISAHHINYRLEKVGVSIQDSEYGSVLATQYLNNIFTKQLNQPAYSQFTLNTYGTENAQGFKPVAHKPYIARKAITDYGAIAKGTMTNKNFPVFEFKFERFRVIAYITNSPSPAFRGELKPIRLRASHDLRGYSYEIDYSDAAEYIIPYYLCNERARATGYDDTYVAYITDSIPAGTEAENVDGSTTTAGETSQYQYKWINGAGESPILDYCTAKLVDLSSEFNKRPTPSALASKAIAYFNENHVNEPYCNLTINYSETDPALEPEYIHPSDGPVLYLCDTCTVEFEDIGLTATMKVVKAEYNVLLGRYEQLEFGSLQRTLYTTGSVLGTSGEGTNYSTIIAEDIEHDSGDEEISPEDIYPE